MVWAASRFNLVLREWGPHWEEGLRFTGPPLLCGGESSTRLAFKISAEQVTLKCFLCFSLYRTKKERETSLSSDVQTKASRSAPRTKRNGRSGSRVRQLCSVPVERTSLIQHFGTFTLPWINFLLLIFYKSQRIMNRIFVQLPTEFFLWENRKLFIVLIL